jgi:hypothetical protein
MSVAQLEYVTIETWKVQQPPVLSEAFVTFE